MKKIVLQLFKLFMNFIYIFIKLFKTKHKVTFLSRQSNDITLDFKFLITQLTLLFFFFFFHLLSDQTYRHLEVSAL